MVYLFFSKDHNLALSFLESHLKERKVDPSSLSRYDLYRDDIQTALDDYLSFSFTGENRNVVVTHADFLKEAADKKNISSLFKEENENNLYLVMEGIPTSSNPCYKEIKVSGTVKNCTELESEDYVRIASRKAKEEGCSFSKEAALLLLERTKGDFMMFVNYVDILLTLTNDVTLDDVKKMVYEPLDDKAYEITSNLVKGKTKEAIQSFRNVRKQGTDSIVVLLTFITQFRLMALVKRLLEMRLSNDEIAKEISTMGQNVKSGRIYYMSKDLAGLSYLAIVDILSDLGKIEKGIKLDGDDPDTSLEMFMIGFNSYRKQRR